MTQQTQFGGGQVEIVKEKQPDQRLKRPSMYQVWLLNDDYTPMDFVVWVLKTIFHKNQQDSERLMLQVHHQGKGLCGTYTQDIAKTKAGKVEQIARREGHPLVCIIKPAGSPE